MKTFFLRVKEKMPAWLSRLSWSFLAIAVIGYLAVDRVNRNQWNENHWKDNMGSDGTGYYSYLPATFLYHDFSFHFIDSLPPRYPRLTYAVNCGFCNEFEGKKVDKFFAGEAVLVTPFFLGADLITRFSHEPRDGYSFYYMCALNLAAIFYMLVGMFSIRALLRRRNVSDWKTGIVLIALFFGTNLYHYTLWDPSMTHAYSFGLIGLFVCLLDSLCRKFSSRNLLFAGIVFGLIVITRPINALSIASLPFIAGNFETLKKFFRELFHHYLALAGTAVLFAAVIFIQLLAYHAQSGQWYVYAYNKEGFDFLHPHFWQCLFSYNNGMYVYSPLLLIATAGVLTLVKDSYRLLSFLLFFCLVVWAISSWWAWTYGGSFGMRPMVDYYVFFGLLFGLLLDKLKTVAVIALSLLMVPLIWYMQFTTWQFHYGMIVWDGMSKEKYWRVFLHDEPQFMFLNTEGPPPAIPDNTKLLYSANCDFEQPDSIFVWEKTDGSAFVSGKSSAVFIDPQSSPPYWKHRLSEVIPDSLYAGRSLWLSVKMKLWLEDADAASRLVIIQERDGAAIYFNNPPFVRQVSEPEQWTDYGFNVFIPDTRPGDLFTVTLSKEDTTKILVDDMQVRFFLQQ